MVTDREPPDRQGGFATVGNFLNLGRSVAVLGLGMGLVVIGRGLDLSQIASMAVPTAIGVQMMAGGYPLLLCLLVGLCVAIAIGMVNGLIISFVEIPALFTTLATNFLVYGIARELVLNGFIAYVPAEQARFLQIGQGSVLGIPAPILVFAAMAAIVHWFMSGTRTGRFIYAHGDITILRDGRRVVTEAAADLTREQIVRHMVGRDVTQSHYGSRAAAPGSNAGRREKVLSVENVTMGNIVKNMSFSIYAGEVVGMAGLIGAGRTEISQVIAGVRKRDLVHGGMIYLRGRPIRYRVPKQAIDDGIVYITEDRKVNGFFETMTVDDNIYVGRLATRLGRRFFLSRRQRRGLADTWVERLKIAATHRTSRIVQLSGGNQQKVVVAKSLVQEPEVVIFDEPTRGVDVGTIPQIHKAIRDLAAEGKAVVVISSYLPELLSVADRILVARQGRIAEEFSAADATEDKIMYAAIH
ncbi:MAG: ATP-binding cassette domain-containing protein [Sneathiellaceae bacterium]